MTDNHLYIPATKLGKVKRKGMTIRCATWNVYRIILC